MHEHIEQTLSEKTTNPAGPEVLPTVNVSEPPPRPGSTPEQQEAERVRRSEKAAERAKADAELRERLEAELDLSPEAWPELATVKWTPTAPEWAPGTTDVGIFIGLESPFGDQPGKHLLQLHTSWVRDVDDDTLSALRANGPSWSLSIIDGVTLSSTVVVESLVPGSYHQLTRALTSIDRQVGQWQTAVESKRRELLSGLGSSGVDSRFVPVELDPAGMRHSDRSAPLTSGVSGGVASG